MSSLHLASTTKATFNPIYQQLLPLQLRDRLLLVVSEAEDKPFYTTTTALYHLVRRTVVGKAHVATLDSFYPQNVVVWNRYYADWVISDIYEILEIIHKDIFRCNLSVVEFDSRKVEREVTAVCEFIETIYKNHIPLQFATYIDLSHIENQCVHIGSAVMLCRDILDTLAVKTRFEKSPSIKRRKSVLWNKLHRTNATSNLLREGSIDPICPVCQHEELAVDGNFAIADCGDILCVNCAQTMFDVPSFKESRCPLCDATISAWTDHKHFLLFKTAINLKAIVWRSLATLQNDDSLVNPSWPRRGQTLL